MGMKMYDFVYKKKKKKNYILCLFFVCFVEMADRGFSSGAWSDRVTRDDTKKE